MYRPTHLRQHVRRLHCGGPGEAEALTIQQVDLNLAALGTE